MPKAHFQYEIIAEDLRQNIHSGKYAVGSRLPSEPELALTYGVNHLTLRKALALVQAKGLLDRRPGRGTFVLSPPTPPANASSGVVVFFGRTQGHLHDRLFSALVRDAQATGRSVYPFDPLTTHGTEVRNTVHRLLANDAPILVGEGLLPELLRQFPDVTRKPIQVGFQGDHWPVQPGYHVAADMLRAGLLATRHLLGLGHRRLAFVGAHPEEGIPAGSLSGVKSTNPAYEGCRLALAEAGIGEHRTLGYYDAGVDQHGVQIDREFLDQLDGWATAFICDSDFRAVTLHQALWQRDLRIPQAVSVVGIGNTPWCQAIGDGLDSVDLAEDELASLALRLAVSSPSTPAEPVFFRVGPRLVVRASSGAPPAGKSEQEVRRLRARSPGNKRGA